jgi:AcrR family transcriptional regulator
VEKGFQKMGRKAGFQPEQVYTAVASLMAAGNGVALRELSAVTGVSIGSLYHRFDGMDAILAETWLWAAEEFQQMFVPWLHKGTHRAGLRAAVQLPIFCQKDPQKALVLVGARTRDYLQPSLNAELSERVAILQSAKVAAFDGFVDQAQLDRDAADLALLRWPMSVARLYLPQRPVPDEAQLHVRNGYWAALKLGDAKA